MVYRTHGNSDSRSQTLKLESAAICANAYIKQYKQYNLVANDQDGDLCTDSLLSSLNLLPVKSLTFVLRV
jgi:hypothetical protein